MLKNLVWILPETSEFLPVDLNKMVATGQVWYLFLGEITETVR